MAEASVDPGGRSWPVRVRFVSRLRHVLPKEALGLDAIDHDVVILFPRKWSLLLIGWKRLSVGAFLRSLLDHVGGNVQPARFRNNLLEIMGSFNVIPLETHFHNRV